MLVMGRGGGGGEGGGRRWGDGVGAVHLRTALNLLKYALFICPACLKCAQYIEARTVGV